MEQTNKIKAFLTVLATTTALSSGFAVTWGTDGKIQLEESDKRIIQTEYDKFIPKHGQRFGPTLGTEYYLSQFKGELEQKLKTELSHDDFASILDEVGYGTDTDTKQTHKTERTKLLGFLQQQPFAGAWNGLSLKKQNEIRKEYGDALTLGTFRNSLTYTLSQFKGKIEELLEKPISLDAFRSILEGLGYDKTDKMKAYFNTVKPRPDALPSYGSLFPNPPQDTPERKQKEAETHYTAMPAALKIDLDAIAVSLSKYLSNKDEDTRNLNNVKGMIKQNIKKNNQYIQEDVLENLVNEVVGKVEKLNSGLIILPAVQPVAQIPEPPYETKKPSLPARSSSPEPAYVPLAHYAPKVEEGPLSLQITAGNIIHHLQQSNMALTEENAKQVFDSAEGLSPYILQNKEDIIRRVLASGGGAVQERSSLQLMHQSQHEQETHSSTEQSKNPSSLFEDPAGSHTLEDTKEPSTESSTDVHKETPQTFGRQKIGATVTQSAPQQPTVSTPTQTQAPQTFGRPKIGATVTQSAPQQPTASTPTQTQASQTFGRPKIGAPVTQSAPQQLTASTPTQTQASQTFGRPKIGATVTQSTPQQPTAQKLSRDQIGNLVRALSGIGGIPDKDLPSYQLGHFTRYIDQQVGVQLSQEEILEHTQGLMDYYENNQSEIQTRSSEDQAYFSLAYLGAQRLMKYFLPHQSSGGQVDPFN